MNYVEISIYNLLGHKVTTLVSEIQQAGIYQCSWDASGQASGVYFYKLKLAGTSQTRKMILLH